MSSAARTDVVRDALEQTLFARQPPDQGGVIHHSDRGVQDVSIRYTERLAEAGIETSVERGRRVRPCLGRNDHNGIDKAEVIHRQSWKNREAVELATLAWVDGFNHRRLLGPIGNVPPAEAEEASYRLLAESAMAV